MNQAIENASMFFMNQGEFKIDEAYSAEKSLYLIRLKRDLIAAIQDIHNDRMVNIVNAYILARCIELIGPLASYTVVAEDTFNDQSKIGYHLKTLCNQIGEMTSAIDVLDKFISNECVEAAKLIRLHCEQAIIHANLLINTIKGVQRQFTYMEASTLNLAIQNVVSVIDIVVALREVSRIYLEKVAGEKREGV